MKTSEVIQAWKSVLSGRRPSLAIEITRECPLRCPDVTHMKMGVGNYKLHWVLQQATFIGPQTLSAGLCRERSAQPKGDFLQVLNWKV